MDWLDGVLLLSAIIIILWFAEKIVIAAVYFASRGRVTVNDFTPTRISSVRVSLRTACLDVSNITFRYSRRRLLVRVGKLHLNWLAAGSSTPPREKGTKTENGGLVPKGETGKSKDLKLKSLSYYILMWVRISVESTEVTCEGSDVALSFHRLDVAARKVPQVASVHVEISLSSLEVSRSVASLEENSKCNIFTCYQASTKFVFSKSRSSYKLSKIECEFLEPIVFFNEIKSVIKNTKSRSPEKSQKSPEEKMISIHQNMLGKLKKMKYVPKNISCNITAFRIENLVPDFKMSNCIFDHLSIDLSSDVTCILSEITVPSCSFNFANNSYHTLVITNLESSVSILELSLEAKLVLEDINSHVCISSPDSEKSQSIDLVLERMSNVELGFKLQIPTRSSSSSLEDSDRIFLEAAVSELRMTASRRCDTINDTPLNLYFSELKVTLSGCDYVFHSSISLDSINFDLSAIFVEVLKQKLSELRPKKEKKLKDVAFSRKKITFKNDLFSVKHLNCCLFSDEVDGYIHKAEFQVYDFMRSFPEYSDVICTSLRVIIEDAYSNELDFIRLDSLVIKEQVLPWKSIEVKFKAISVNWTTNRHMTLYVVVKSYLKFRSAKSPKKLPSDSPKLLANIVEEKMKKLPAISLSSEKVSIHLITQDCSSKDDGFTNDITISNLRIANSSSSCDIKTSYFEFRADRNPIWRLSEVFIRYVTISSASTIDREKSNLASKNHCLHFETTNCIIWFPYQYKFHENFSRFTLVRKWAKNLHMPKKESSPSDSGSKTKLVWPDFDFYFHNFSIIFEDSNFEKKLSDNYRLLSDEILQQLIRHELFEQKLEEIQLKNPSLITRDIRDQMESSLREEDSRAYIERWKASREYFTEKKELFNMTFTNFHVCCFADEEMTGQENIIKNIQELDNTTRVPADIHFSSHACRLVHLTCDELCARLRDYPDPMYQLTHGRLSGKLLLVQPTSFSHHVHFTVGPSFPTVPLKRSPGALKWFYDLTLTTEHVLCNWSQNRDPAWNEVNYAVGLVNKPSQDPSPPLPFWDKARQKSHGRFVSLYNELEITWLCCLDPYRQSEKLKFVWNNAQFEWMPASLNLMGDLRVVICTAVKQTKLTFIDWPRTKMCWNFTYICKGDPNAHHAIQFKPEEADIPGYDTYAKFRSQSFDLLFTLRLSPKLDNREDRRGSVFTMINEDYLLDKDMPAGTPKIMTFGSTFRWFHSTLALFRTVSRPIRRGALWNNPRSSKKPGLMRHFRNAQTRMQVPCLTFDYRVSASRDRGIVCYLTSEAGLSSQQSLYVDRPTPVHNDLGKVIPRRPSSRWITRSLTFDLNSVHIFIISDHVNEEECSVIDNYIKNNLKKTIPWKLHFLTIISAKYERLELSAQTLKADQMEDLNQSGSSESKAEHNLTVFGLRCSWSRRNRDLVVWLYDNYLFNRSLRQNLSSDALKPITVISNSSKRDSVQRSNSASGSESGGDAELSKLELKKRHDAQLLEKLMKDAETNFIGYCEDKEVQEEVKEISMADVFAHRLKVNVSDLQVKLLGFDSPGLVIVTASAAQINRNEHDPLWWEDKIYSKYSLIVSFTGMQYFATLSRTDLVTCAENDESVAWLPTKLVVIEEDSLSRSQDERCYQEEIGVLVSSGASYSLQKIISPCSCIIELLNFNSLSETDDLTAVVNVPAKKDEANEAPVSSVRLRHNDLRIVTNSFQYSLVLDILNNLIFYQEQSRKTSNENLKILKLSMRVNESDDLKEIIIELQRSLREGEFRRRELERGKVALTKKLQQFEASSSKFQVGESEHANSSENQNCEDANIASALDQCNEELKMCKDEQHGRATRLKLAMTCYKELQLKSKIKILSKEEPVPLNNKEIVFSNAKWSLTEKDGQIEFADVCLQNFHYTKVIKTDDSTEHKFTVMDATLLNLISGDHYRNILQVSEESKNESYCVVVQMKEKTPVGGIQLRELLDIKIVALDIQLTEAFWKRMKQFLFPPATPEKEQALERHQMRLLTMTGHCNLGSDANLSSASSYSLSSLTPKKRKEKKTKKTKTDSLARPPFGNEVVDVALERAAKNCMFVAVKVRETPLLVSYRGDKKKNIEDVTDMKIHLPRIELYNMTLTWRDLLDKIRKEVTKTVVKGVLQEKLRIKGRAAISDEEQARKIIDPEVLKKKNGLM